MAYVLYFLIKFVGYVLSYNCCLKRFKILYKKKKKSPYVLLKILLYNLCYCCIFIPDWDDTAGMISQRHDLLTRHQVPHFTCSVWKYTHEAQVRENRQQKKEKCFLSKHFLNIFFYLWIPWRADHLWHLRREQVWCAPRLRRHTEVWPRGCSSGPSQGWSHLYSTHDMTSYT